MVTFPRRFLGELVRRSGDLTRSFRDALKHPKRGVKYIFGLVVGPSTIAIMCAHVEEMKDAIDGGSWLLAGAFAAVFVWTCFVEGPSWSKAWQLAFMAFGAMFLAASNLSLSLAEFFRKLAEVIDRFLNDD